MNTVGGSNLPQHRFLHRVIQPRGLYTVMRSDWSKPPSADDVVEWFETQCRHRVGLTYTWDTSPLRLESSEMHFWEPNADNHAFMQWLEYAWIGMLRSDVRSITFWFDKERNSWSEVSFRLHFPNEWSLRLRR